PSPEDHGGQDQQHASDRPPAARSRSRRRGLRPPPPPRLPHQPAAKQRRIIGYAALRLRTSTVWPLIMVPTGICIRLRSGAGFVGVQSLLGLIPVAVNSGVQVAAVGGGRVELVVVGGRVRLLLPHWWAPLDRRGCVGGRPAAARPGPGPCPMPRQPA